MPVPAALDPILQVMSTFKDLLPNKAWFKHPHFNFLSIHYFYLIGLSILGSLILFAGGMPYIDALFFSTGAATQSGLNTIDVNAILLYQQIILMMWACIATPVFINTVVVFVRLYWFEKRFKHIVMDARELRKTWEKSRTKSEARKDIENENLERGVNGRSITVLHDTTRPNGMSAGNSQENEEAAQFKEKMGLQEHDRSVNSGASSSEDSIEHRDQSGQTTLADTNTEEAPKPLANRAITFDDELPAAQQQPDLSQHIAIVQRQQQNAKSEGGTLRIPGPRDFDRGEGPEEIDDGRANRERSLHKIDTASSETQKCARMLTSNSEHEQTASALSPRHAITFNEPARPQHGHDDNAEATSPHKSTLNKLVSPLRMRSRKSGSDLGEHGSTFAKTLTNFSKTFSQARQDEEMPYLSWQATIGRNSAFVNLTAAQREELGGIEYRALKLLAKILIGYYIGFHVMAMIIFLPWILHVQPWTDIVISDGIDPGWWGVFTAASMFNDLGLTLTPDSMISFNTSTAILLTGSFFIIIGNTGFPVMLRFIIWLLHKFTADGSPTKDELQFLLDHPRRCFTLLFPSRANWWLFWILVLFNVIDLVFFIILDLNDPTVTDLAPGFRVLNGWFQATSTRTAGFSSVNIADLHPAIQVSYLIMMYISVLPIAISVRRTNVYEEKSLGIWGGDNEEAHMEDPSYVGQHLRRQLSFDLWYIFLGFFIIAIVEGPRLQDNDDPAFSMFAVLFEIVSAYGTVGLSLGYPTINASFSAELHTISKLVIIAMMIRGRHRGLPYALDRAILLPSEKQYSKEAEDADRRYERRASTFPGGEPGFGPARTDDHGMDEKDEDVDRLAARPGSRRRSQLERRASTVSSTSNGKPRQRGKSLATLLMSGLTAGPTFHKDD